MCKARNCLYYKTCLGKYDLVSTEPHCDDYRVNPNYKPKTKKEKDK